MGTIYDRPPKSVPPAPIPGSILRQRRLARWRRQIFLGLGLIALTMAVFAHLVWRAHHRLKASTPASSRFGVPGPGSPLPPSTAFIRVEQAYTLMRAGRMDEAERLLARVLDGEPDNDSALRLLGLLHLQRGRLGDAMLVFRRALKNPATRAETLNNMATVMMRRGELELAEEIWLDALALDPGHAGANLNLGLLYITWKQYDKAAVRLEAARGALPDHAGLLNNLAVCRMRTGQPAAARELLERAIAGGPATAPPLFNVAMTFALETNAVAALDWIRRARAHCTATEAYAALADPDFDAVRRQPGFAEMVARLRAEAGASATNRTAQ